MIIPSAIIDSFVPIAAGIVVSLVSKYIMSEPSVEHCRRPEAEEADDESEPSNKTEMSDALSRASASTT